MLVNLPSTVSCTRFTWRRKYLSHSQITSARRKPPHIRHSHFILEMMAFFPFWNQKKSLGRTDITTVLISSLFHWFFANVHSWFPFLDPPSCIAQYSNPRPVYGTNYCKFLLMMALGSMAEDDRVSSGLNWAEQFAQPAFSMLPSVASGDDLESVQCLILFWYALIDLSSLSSSIYFLWLLRPAQSFNYIGQASIKIQNLIYSSGTIPQRSSNFQANRGNVG